MGLFNKIKDPVEGTAQVVGCSAPDPNETTIGRTSCRLNVVLTAPGVDAVAVEKVKFVPGAKYPYPGMVLPVTIDRSKPERFDIDWDQVISHKDQTRQRTAEAAEAARTGHDPQASADPGASAADQLGQMFPGAQIEIEGDAGALDADTLATIQSALGGGPGMTVDSTAAVDETPATGGSGTDDRIAQLERLAGLHQAGALTDEEFAAEKTRLLGSG